MKEYQIQIDETQSYPFDGPKNSKLAVKVKKTYKITSQQRKQQLSQKIDFLLELESIFLIQMLKISQIKDKQYAILYEYVPTNIRRVSRLSQNNYQYRIKSELISLINFLVTNRIKKTLNVEDLGFIEGQGNLKIFMDLNFTIINESERSVLKNQYMGQMDKVIDNLSLNDLSRSLSENTMSEYSNKMGKRLNEIQSKIRMRSKNKKKKDLRKGSTELYPNTYKDYDKDKSRLSTGNKAGSQSQFPQMSRSNEKETLEVPVQSKIQKIHKKSLGDMPSLLKEEEKDQSLSARISHALSKTQQTFKFYEKKQRKKRLWL